jgi:hypothetical protein
MKIIKKYDYKLTEETLDKDMEQFIKEALKGAYTWDYKHEMKGLRIIKQYSKLIQKEFEQGNYELCKICYKKLFMLLFGENSKHSCFGYEDIVGRSKLDFNKIIKNYFLCLIKLHSVEELFNEYVEYLKSKQDYYFENAEKIIIQELNDESFAKFKELLEKEAEQVNEKDYAMQDILTFLLDIAKKKEGNKEKFTELAMKYAPVLGYGDLNQFMEDYEEK